MVIAHLESAFAPNWGGTTEGQEPRPEKVDTFTFLFSRYISQNDFVL